MNENKERGSSSIEKPYRRTTAEWVVLGISLLIVFGFVGFIIYDLIAGSDVDPTLEVTIHYERLREEGEAFYLPITVVNRGGRTAEDVSIHFLLINAGDEPPQSESMSLTFRFLAPGEEAEAVLIFDQDPRTGELLHTSTFLRP